MPVPSSKCLSSFLTVRASQDNLVIVSQIIPDYGLIMGRLIGLEVLVAIVDSGGFSRAAERLAMSRTMVSVHLARLEDRLGTQLIRRSTRRFTLTPQGHFLVDEARTILAALERAENAVRQTRSGTSGRVAIDVPGAIGLRFIAPALSAFRIQQPGITLDLSLGDHTTTLRPDGYDLLIRIGPAEGKGAIFTLGRTRLVQVASPDYIARKGMPFTLDDLRQHDCILYTTTHQPVGQWQFSRQGKNHVLRPRSAATFNHGDAITSAALTGIGIAQTLEMLVSAELADGRLIPVLEDWNDQTVPLQLFIPADSVGKATVCAVADFLRQNIAWPGARA